MAAGWLVDGLAGAGCLAGRPQVPQDLRDHGQLRESVFRGADNNQFASIQDRNKEGYKLQGRKNAGLQGLQGYKATRLEGLQEHLLQRSPPQLGGPQGAGGSYIVLYISQSLV